MVVINSRTEQHINFCPTVIRDERVLLAVWFLISPPVSFLAESLTSLFLGWFPDRVSLSDGAQVRSFGNFQNVPDVLYYSFIHNAFFKSLLLTLSL